MFRHSRNSWLTAFCTIIGQESAIMRWARKNHQGVSVERRLDGFMVVGEVGALLLVEHLVLTVAALILRHDLLHFSHDLHVVILQGEVVEVHFVLARQLVGVFADGSHLDLRVDGRLGLLRVVEHLLVEFLAVAQTRVFDLDVFGSREFYHALSQVGDADRIAHVEDEDLAAMAHRASLQHQAAGLGDEHEVADDVLVGDGDGASLLDLLFEERDDRSVGAEHVAEAGGDKLRHALYLAVLDGLVERLAIDLADALAATHDVGGIDGLVGGDHHKLARLVFDGQVGDDACAEDVVLYGHGGVVLHHRHVLVGRGVEDILRLVGGEDLFHLRLVGDGADDGPHLQVLVVVHHVEAHVVHRRLGLIDQYQLRGLEGGHLARHFRPDASRRARDEDAVACEHLLDGLHVHLDLVARQQFLDVHLVEQRVGDGRFAVPLLCRRHHHDLDLGGDEPVDKLGVVGEVFRLQRRDQQRLHVELAHGLHQFGRVLIDLDAGDARGGHHLVVADESLDLVARARVGDDASRQGYGPRLGAIDKDVLGNAEVVVEVVERLGCHARRPHQHRGRDEDLHAADEARHEDVVAQTEAYLQLVEDADGDARREAGVGHAAQVDEAGVAEHAVERVEDEEGQHVEYHAEANAQAHAIQVRVEVVHAILKGIDKQSRYQHRKGVVSEDTPIRKRASGEGPFDKSVE